MTRTDAQWFYVGVTHENLTNGNRFNAVRRAELLIHQGSSTSIDKKLKDEKGNSIQINKESMEKAKLPPRMSVVEIFHDISGNSLVNKRNRWQLDLKLLLEEWEMNPNRTRTGRSLTYYIFVY